MPLPIPRTSDRPGGSLFAEVVTALGPEIIGDTQDNTYEALYGRPYVLILTRDRRLRLFRGDPAGGAWTEVTAGLPTSLFGPQLPATVERISMAFDQSARIIVAVADGGQVKVTRWDAGTQQYVQNITFDGRDPQLLMDATVADPRGYPNVDDDGWSVREAYYAGIPVLFLWVPDDTYRQTAIPDSDVLLFYLTPDRLGVRCRVQRQLYLTPQTIHDYDAPVIMDRALSLPGRYQLLVSDAASGEPLDDMLISDPYLGDFIITQRLSHPLDASVAPEGLRAESDTYPAEDSDELAASVTPEAVEVVGDTFFYADEHEVDGSVTPEAVEIVSDTLPYADDDDLEASVAPETPIPVIEMVVFQEGTDELDASVAPEAIRVQTV